MQDEKRVDPDYDCPITGGLHEYEYGLIEVGITKPQCQVCGHLLLDFPIYSDEEG